MAIYLARHGEAVSVEKDPEKPLSHKGKSEVEKMADLLKSLGLKVNKIKHSEKKRARETAEIFSSKISSGTVSEIQGLNPNDDVKTFWKEYKNIDDIMYVGHLPFMERLAAFIITGDDKNTLLKIKTGGVVCLEKKGDNWYIGWMMNPYL